MKFFLVGDVFRTSKYSVQQMILELESGRGKSQESDGNLQQGKF